MRMMLRIGNLLSLCSLSVSLLCKAPGMSLTIPVKVVSVGHVMVSLSFVQLKLAWDPVALSQSGDKDLKLKKADFTCFAPTNLSHIILPMKCIMHLITHRPICKSTGHESLGFPNLQDELWIKCEKQLRFQLHILPPFSMFYTSSPPPLIKTEVQIWILHMTSTYW